MTLSSTQAAIIVLMVALGTIMTRFLPFLIFSGKTETHPYIAYLGKVLPFAAIGLLVVYCLRNVQVAVPSSLLPTVIAILLIAGLHVWKNNVLLSIGAGTACYMVLVQTVFAGG